MALSLDTIYKPIKDFFLKRFNSENDKQVFFRFDELGIIVTDKDYIDPTNAGNSSKALEEFSDLVNLIPVVSKNGVNVTMKQEPFDDAYFFEILTPSIPYAPENSDDLESESIISTLVKIKNEADKDWNILSQARGESVIDKFRPSYSTPDKWFDSSNTDIWTKYTTSIDAGTTASVDNPDFNLWRLKVDDSTLEKMMSEEKDKSTLYADAVAKLSALKSTQIAGEATMFRSPALKAATSRVQDNAPVLVTLVAQQFAQEPQTVQHTPEPLLLPSYEIMDNYKNKISGFDIKNRLLMTKMLKKNAQTQAATTKSISIEMEYCLVKIRRPWFSDSLIRNKSWYIPGIKKGALNKYYSALPVGFLAIKNLNIEANWSDIDRTTSKKATDFGPFEVNSEIVNNKLSHEGIQIIGWILQRIPQLPPNSAG